MKSLFGPSPEQFASNKTQSFAFTEERRKHPIEWNARSNHSVPCWSMLRICFDLVELIYMRFWRLPMTVAELEPTLARTSGLFADTSDHRVGPFNVAG